MTCRHCQMAWSQYGYHSHVHMQIRCGYRNFVKDLHAIVLWVMLRMGA